MLICGAVLSLGTPFVKVRLTLQVSEITAGLVGKLLGRRSDVKVTATC